MKRCSKCGIEKPLDDFHRQASNKTDGRKGECRACIKGRSRLHYLANKERIDAANTTWYWENRESALQRRRLWLVENRELNRKRCREWAAANRELKRAITRRWEEANPERVQAIKARWVRNHPEHTAEMNHRRRCVRHPGESCRARIAALLTEPCAYCGALGTVEVDHVIPLSRGGTHTGGQPRPRLRVV
jgi:5-methylcytosine-specific restriction endonuclease McrA